MHPIFSLDNLSRLPASVRDLAIAATTSPTKPDIRLLATRARGLTLSQRMLLFPVPYSLLDPAKIPIVDDLDGRFSLERIASAIVRAKFAFDLIMVTAEDIPMIPKKAFQDLWGRAWEWISFLETQPYTHLDPIGDDRPVIDLRALIYINQFLPGSNTRQMIYSTPGVCGTVAKIWAAAVLSGSCIVPNGIFGGLSYFIGACDSLNDTLLGEFVEGSGGCLRDFSSLIVRHIDFFASGANGSQVPDITPANIGTYLDAVLTFLFNAMLIPEIRNKTRFMEGLISQGIIAALSSAAQTLEGSIPERSAHALRTAERCWDLLDRILADHECSPRGLSDGLHAGLLLAIVSGCDGARTCDTLRSLRNILSTNLPAFTSYHSVLTHVKGCFNDELLKAVTAEEFKGCSIYTEWHYFVTLMIERFKLLDWFNSRDVESLKGCDNMKCGGIHPKSELMRCAGCFSMYYCSKACQSRDWREGHHRDSCSKLRGSRFLENEAGITTRDRSFLRELVHHDYKVAREDILSGQLAMLTRFPDTPFCILFDYRHGRPSVSALPATGSVAVDALQFTNFVSREQASTGRVETHLILIRQPRSHYPKIFPMYSSTSMVRESLERIASAMRLLGPGRSLRQSPTELKSAMSRLGEDQDKKVVYTH